MDVAGLLDRSKDTEIGVMASPRMVPDRQMHLPTFTSKTKPLSRWLTINRQFRGGVVSEDMVGEGAVLAEVPRGVERLAVGALVGALRPDGGAHDHLCAGDGRIGTR